MKKSNWIIWAVVALVVYFLTRSKQNPAPAPVAIVTSGGGGVTPDGRLAA